MHHSNYSWYQQSVTLAMAQYHAVKTGYDPGCLFAAENLEVPTDRSSSSTTTRESKQSAGPRDYKPTALRWYYHVALIASFAVLIGLTEYAIRTLQVSSDTSVDLSHLQSLQGEARRAVSAASHPLFDARKISNTTSSNTGTTTTTMDLNGYLTIGKTTVPVTMTSTSSISTSELSSTSPDVSSPTEQPDETTTPFLETKTTALTTQIIPHVTTTVLSGLLTTVTVTVDTSAYLEIGSTTLTSASTQTGSVSAAEYDPSSYLEVGTMTILLETGSSSLTSFAPTEATSTSEETAFLHTGSTSLTLTSDGAVGLETQAETQARTATTAIDDIPSAPAEPNAQIPSISTWTDPGVTVLIVSQTTTGPSSTVTSQRTVTNAAGQATVETLESTVAGKTSVFESTMTMGDSTSDIQPNIVVSQTVVEPSRVASVEKTTTGEDGQIVVQTYQTTLPGETSISRSTSSASSGQTVVVQPSVVKITTGGTTKVAQTIFTDSQGHFSTSSYTTVIGGAVTSSTIAVLMSTSVASGDTLVTFQEVVTTTVGGVTEVLETTLTDTDGHVTSSSYTTVIGGTPTSLTVWTIEATSAPSGETIITLPTVVPATNGGTTEVFESSFTDSQGVLHTSFYTTVIGGTPTSSTLWTVLATHMPTSTSTPTPTKASTSSSSSGAASGSSSGTQTTTTVVYGITWRQYVVGTFFPTLIAVLISFPLKLIAINARLMQPFHALAAIDEASGGSPADASIFLRFYSWSGSFSFLQAIKLRQPVIAISDVLTLGAGLLAPLAAEAIAVHVPDTCRSACYGSLVASLIPIRVLEALMSVIVALLLALVILLSIRRWKTGVSCNPWSIAGMASLCVDPKYQKVLKGLPSGLAAQIEDSTISTILAGRTYTMGDIVSESSSREYGVKVVDHDEGATRLLKEAEPTQADETPMAAKYSTQPFSLLTWWGRCIMLSVFSGVLIMLVYYENTSGDSGFERFMDSQGFAVKFFITAVGVLLGYCMETVFRCQYKSTGTPGPFPPPPLPFPSLFPSADI